MVKIYPYVAYASEEQYRLEKESFQEDYENLLKSSITLSDFRYSKTFSQGLSYQSTKQLETFGVVLWKTFMKDQHEDWCTKTNDKLVKSLEHSCQVVEDVARHSGLTLEADQGSWNFVYNPLKDELMRFMGETMESEDFMQTQFVCMSLPECEIDPESAEGDELFDQPWHVWEERRLMLVMSQHKRLGAESSIKVLSSDILKMILSWVRYC